MITLTQTVFNHSTSNWIILELRKFLSLDSLSITSVITFVSSQNIQVNTNLKQRSRDFLFFFIRRVPHLVSRKYCLRTRLSGLRQPQSQPIDWLYHRHLLNFRSRY